MIPKALLLSTLITIVNLAPVQATVGFAEWEIKTPGNSFIGKTDSFPNSGTYLVSRHSESNQADSKIYASQIEWWQYYAGHISGKAKEGFFLFNERRRSIQFFKSDQALKTAIAALQLRSTSQPMTPIDGWRQVWEPLLREACQRQKC